MKAVNLIRATTLEFSSREYQCSDPAVKLAGAVFESGLSMTQFMTAVRQSGLRVSKAKLLALSKAFADASVIFKAYNS